MSSADVCTEFLNKYRKDKTVYLLGTPALEEHFISHKIPLVTDKQPDITVVSFDTTLTYEKLKNACTYIRNGAEFLSTHPDFNCPVKDGYIPDSGAICAAVTASTGVSPRYFGKPYPETADMICEITGVERNDMCIFGDRLYTDIALGKANGITATLVLTGEATLEDVENAPEEAPAPAPRNPQRKPTKKRKKTNRAHNILWLLLVLIFANARVSTTRLAL